jgi:hypothetical protein
MALTRRRKRLNLCVLKVHIMKGPSGRCLVVFNVKITLE